MAERPMLMSAPMVRALLAGTKTQTRRAVKPQPRILAGELLCWKDDALTDDQMAVRCPYGQPGDRLWVREAFMHEPADYCWEASVSIPCRPASTVYRADFHESQPGEGWKPSIHMPRSLSRILLEITAVRVERLQDISHDDACAEGIESQKGGAAACIERYRDLWKSINGPDSWDANPWVWVVEFKRVRP
ncbi:hypothetical protein [Methyloversatilis sp.]|uniref:hypothetical protein n=1 Tax=Methyloversatilis sp. TaxID=2569862 RepID=UPI003D2D2921